MSISDEQFKATLFELSCIRLGFISDRLRARDTAQREALARVEAERDWWKEQRDILADYCRRADERARTAQAQLADVLYILDQHRAWAGMGWEQLPVPVHAVDKIRSKVAQAEQQEAREPVLARPEHGVTLEEALALTMDRYSGALDKLAVIEQKEALELPGMWDQSDLTGGETDCDQEAQGAQAGDERAAFERWSERADKFHASGYNPHSDLWEAWQARAALATQPAAGEPQAKPIAYVNYAANGQPYLDWLPGGEDESHALFGAPPAAAHGDEAVLDVLKTAYESGYQDGQDAPNAYSDEKVKHRIALSLLEEMMADAAMRAQAGEGGEV